MQYEEYRDRMVAQGRTPLPREHYASQVEFGYMLADRLRHAEDDLAAALDAEAKEAGRLRDELAERDALIERLIQSMTVDQTRRFMLAQMAAREED